MAYSRSHSRRADYYDPYRDEEYSRSRYKQGRLPAEYEQPYRHIPREPSREEYEQRRVEYPTHDYSARPSRSHSRRDYESYESDYHRYKGSNRPVRRSSSPSQQHPRRESYQSSRKDHHNPDYSRSSKQYERRPYRSMIILSDEERSSRHSPGYSRQYSSKSARNENTSYLRSKPRKSYDVRTREAPRHYPINGKPPGPLPLLVLDLNGTLVCRTGGVGNASDRSKHPVLRPYLKSFLRYCLAVPGLTGSVEDNKDAWDEWEADRGSRMSAKKSKSCPHGAHFWSDNRCEPLALGDATFRLLIWSSAQPHNVDSMARAILSPEQAEQMLRIYARDTLVSKRLYSQKAPSIKDLEILWAVLNNEETGREAEARLFAEARDREDRNDSNSLSWRGGRQGDGASELSAKKALDSVIFPKLNGDGHYEDGAGYGQHNTLLLDDSVEKARLQPFNHVLLPEFDRDRARQTVQVMQAERKQSPSDGQSSGDESVSRSSVDADIDNVLLQFIGVLEHARYQVNVSSWIRFGGLGNFGGMGDQHPYSKEEEDGASQVNDKVIKEAFKYFTKSSSTSSGLDPNLHTPIQDRTEEFWVQEGKRTLQRHHISLQKF